VDSNGQPLVDEEFTEIAQLYGEARENGSLSLNSDLQFLIPPADLNSRLDVQHYRPSDLQLTDQLTREGAVRLSDVADVVTQSWRARANPEEEIRYVAISDVDPRTMEIVNVQTMYAYEAPSRATYRLRQGDIITATSGASTGTSKHATAIVGEELDGAICSNGFAVLRHIRKVEPLFLLAFLRTSMFLRQVRRLMTGHAIPAITLDDLGSVLVPIPALNVQVRLAERVRHLQELRRSAIALGQALVDDTAKEIQAR
jgi:type I restriction enzyme M protein